MATETTFGSFSFTYLSFLISSLLIIGVLFIVYLFIKKYTRGYTAKTVEILDKIILDRHNVIYLVKFPNKCVYISSGQSGVTILDEIDELEVIEKLPSRYIKRRKFNDVLFKKMGKFSLSDEIDKLEKMEK